MATWREAISIALEKAGESWDDIIDITLTPEQLAATFDDGYGTSEGEPFTAWTRDRVYFPAVYDGAEWCASVARNPGGGPTDHIGGQ